MAVTTVSSYGPTRPPVEAANEGENLQQSLDPKKAEAAQAVEKAEKAFDAWAEAVVGPLKQQVKMTVALANAARTLEESSKKLQQIEEDNKLRETCFGNLTLLWRNATLLGKAFFIAVAITAISSVGVFLSAGFMAAGVAVPLAIPNACAYTVCASMPAAGVLGFFVVRHLN